MVFASETLATGVALMWTEAGVDSAMSGQLLVAGERPSAFTLIRFFSCRKVQTLISFSL